MEETTSMFEGIEEKKIWLTRRELLPRWMKLCCWIFMLFGAMSILCLALGLMGFTTSLALYGLETNEPLSLTGLVVIMLALVKGYTAFALWFEKDYAILLGKIDAISGIVICLIVMVVFPLSIPGTSVTIRFELILLIPYLIRLFKMQKFWDRNAAKGQDGII